MLHKLIQYQPEGHYEPLQKEDLVLDAVTVIKIVPKSIKGKYKIGQHMHPESRKILAQKILEKNSDTSRNTLKIMGFEETSDGLKMIDEPIW